MNELKKIEFTFLGGPSSGSDVIESIFNISALYFIAYIPEKLALTCRHSVEHGYIFLSI
jgi:hypothetical protein